MKSIEPTQPHVENKQKEQSMTASKSSTETTEEKEEVATPPLTFEDITEGTKVILQAMWDTQRKVAGKPQEGLVSTMATLLVKDQYNLKPATHNQLEGHFFLRSLGWAPLTMQFVGEFVWVPKILSIKDETLTVRFPAEDFS